jgi:hypothetical protein
MTWNLVIWNIAYIFLFSQWDLYIINIWWYLSSPWFRIHVCHVVKILGFFYDYCSSLISVISSGNRVPCVLDIAYLCMYYIYNLPELPFNFIQNFNLTSKLLILLSWTSLLGFKFEILYLCVSFNDIYYFVYKKNSV